MADNDEQTFLRRHLITVMLSIIILLVGTVWRVEKAASVTTIETLTTTVEEMDDKIDNLVIAITVLQTQNSSTAKELSEIKTEVKELIR